MELLEEQVVELRRQSQTLKAKNRALVARLGAVIQVLDVIGKGLTMSQHADSSKAADPIRT